MPNTSLAPADIIGQLQPLFQDILDAPTLTLAPAMLMRDLPQWDSLNHVRIISAIEKEFGVRLAASDIENLSTAESSVGNYVAIISKKLAVS